MTGEYTSEWGLAEPLCWTAANNSSYMSVNHEMHAHSISRFVHVTRGEPCAMLGERRRSHCANSVFALYGSPHQLMHRRAGAAQVDKHRTRMRPRGTEHQTLPRGHNRSSARPTRARRGPNSQERDRHSTTAPWTMPMRNQTVPCASKASLLPGAATPALSCTGGQLTGH